MKRKIVALYDPYLDSIGGGERHILSVLQVLEKEAGYQARVFWDTDLTYEISQKLNLTFTDLQFIPHVIAPHSSVVTKLRALLPIDLLFYVTDGSYFFSSAKKTAIFCMVPNKQLFDRTALNALKTRNATYIANSKFTQSWLQKWGITSTVLYPYISDEFIELARAGVHGGVEKEKTILVAGRFFEHLHSKRQDVAIQAFQQLKQLPQFAYYRLVLAGSVHEQDQTYVKKIQDLAANDPAIEIHKNTSFTELLDLYKKAEYYWHFTGFGVDENVSPEKVEHLGITPLEAMAAGCAVFCVNAGGPKEIIHPGFNGMLFGSIDELISQMQSLSAEQKESMVKNAQAYVTTEFTYDHFKKNVLQLFANE